MLELSFRAATPEELRLQLLGFLAKLKDITLERPDRTPIDTTPLDQPVEEIKPVLTMDQMAENEAKAPVHEEPKQPTLEETRAALKALKDKKGTEAVKELLKSFNVSSLTELKPEDYLGAIARAEMEVG